MSGYYGDLQGLNKAETAQKFGDAQVKLWRAVTRLVHTNGERLEDNRCSCPPLLRKHIVPEINAGRNVLVAAHGNSLRALVMKLDNLSQDEVVELNIPTGVPLFYEMNAQSRTPRSSLSVSRDKRLRYTLAMSYRYRFLIASILFAMIP
jgi:2,3-bisphosphoglycerate-dependent phosphoglycerate mutase